VTNFILGPIVYCSLALHEYTNSPEAFEPCRLGTRVTRSIRPSHRKHRKKHPGPEQRVLHLDMPYSQQPRSSVPQFSPRFLASNVPTTKILFSRLSVVVLQAPRCGDESNVIQKEPFTSTEWATRLPMDNESRVLTCVTMLNWGAFSPTCSPLLLLHIGAEKSSHRVGSACSGSSQLQYLLQRHLVEARD
jgi:hypothetical protein